MLGILLYSGDIILLDLYLNDDSLAIYLLAATAIKLLWIGIDSMGLVIYPHFISPDKELKPAVPLVLNRLFIIMSGVLAATFIIFLFAGRPIIRFVYGAQFPALYQLILLLIIATPGVMFYKFLSRFFAAVEQWTPVYTSLIIGIALNVAMIMLLVPQWGIEGAAYASVIAYLSTGFLIAGWYFVGFKKYKVSAT